MKAVVFVEGGGGLKAVATTHANPKHVWVLLDEDEGECVQVSMHVADDDDQEMGTTVWQNLDPRAAFEFGTALQELARLEGFEPE